MHIGGWVITSVSKTTPIYPPTLAHQDKPVNYPLMHELHTHICDHPCYPWQTKPAVHQVLAVSWMDKPGLCTHLESIKPTERHQHHDLHHLSPTGIMYAHNPACPDDALSSRQLLRKTGLETLTEGESCRLRLS